MVGNSLVRELIDIYLDVRDAHSMEDKEKLINYTLIVEAHAAYNLSREFNGAAEQNIEDFVKKYCSNDEMRHKYRSFLLTKGEEKDKKLILKFAQSRSLMKSKDNVKQNEGLFKFKSALFEFINDSISYLTPLTS